MPYWRVSSFYFFYFGVLGVLVPYWGLYLQSLGFSPERIGGLLALMMASRVIAPNVWGWVADHYRGGLAVVRWTSLLAAIAFVGTFFNTDFGWLALVMVTFSFFWHAALPVLDAVAMNYLGHRPGAYGQVRFWGSVGFIVTVVVFGMVVEAYGPWWILPTLLALFVSIWLCSLTLPATRTAEHEESATSFLKFALRPDVVAFLLAGFFMQVSHGPYYTFYSIYLDALGYSKTTIGLLWAFGVLCEIGIFIWMPFLLSRFSLHQVLLSSFLAATVRWLLIGFCAERFDVLIAAQALHAATFGAFHAAGIQIVYRFFTGRHQHRGQALYGTASFGLGGVVGHFYSGYSWGALGPAATFAIAAVAAGIASLVALFWIKPTKD